MFTLRYVLIKFDINVEAANSRSIPIRSLEHGFTVSASLVETISQARNAHALRVPGVLSQRGQ